MTIFRKISAVIALGVLSACNSGDVADKHAITFEKPITGTPPTPSEAEEALRQFLIVNYPDGAAAKDVSLGPIRNASLLLPFPELYYFSCVQYTAKNQYGTYMPPTQILVAFTNPRNEGWFIPFSREPGRGAYNQYCWNQPHSS